MPHTLLRRPAARRSSRTFVLGLLALTACSGDDFDSAQVPRITITPVIAAPLVTIAWTPTGAQQIVVYRGTVADGNAANVVWSISGSSANGLRSPIEYGTNPPPGGVTIVAPQALTAGQPYTVQIGRVDPSNPGGSVSGGRFRYSAVQTFSLAALTPRP